MKAVVPLLLFVSAAASATVRPDPSLGKAAAACRPNEPGPALLVSVQGLKDRRGILRAELYPDNDTDFLQDDAILVNQGKTFRRVDLDLASTGNATLCIRVPGPGDYAMSLLHDRDRNLKFGLFSDGIGFSGNPKLSRSKPKAASARVVAGPGLTRVVVTMNYLHGFMQFGPLERK